MIPFVHNFQRIPSEHELNDYRTSHPPISYQGSPETVFTSSSGFLNPSQNQHRPVAASDGQSPVPTWVSPRTVKVVGFLSHLILTLMPIAFIVLAFLALSCDGDSMSHRGTVVYQASKLGPSIFPIVFAAVVGRLMKTFALWRAERGSTIGLLEQLNGSQNLLAAVERSFLLSNLWGWGLVIIVLWALSPLGGQSSLRVLELAEDGDSFHQGIHYFNTDNFNNTIFAGASAITSGLPTVQAIYQACLLAPASITSSSADIWGNTKIPLMEAQPSYTTGSQDWVEVGHQNDTIYSSLTGIVIAGLNPHTKSNFIVESSYLNLTCRDAVMFGNGDPNSNFTQIMIDFQKWLGNVLIHTNTSKIPFERLAGGTPTDWSSFMIDTNFNFSRNGGNSVNPMNVIFASRNSDSRQIAAYNCTVGSSHVESSISCNGTACQVDKMRHSQNFTQSSVSTPWNQDSSFVPVINFMNYFPWLSGIVHPGEVTPSDYYVSGNNTPFQPAATYGANYKNVSGLQVAQRLGALLNTAWQSSIAQSSIASPPPAQSLFNTQYPPFYARSANAIMQTTQTVYRANKLWVGFTGTISLILLACGIAGMAFRYMTSAPDILGYVSTMTRDNPFFYDQRASDADGLDGLERARLLRDAVVQISDVKPWQGRGHIALKSVAAGESRKSTRLRREFSPSSPLARPV